MPAPGPQETAGHPRYYFPRHIKRQIVTNSTTPPASTSSSSLSSKSSTASNLNARQSTTEKNTFFESLVSLFESQSFADQSSSAQASEDTVQGGPQSPSPTVSSTQPFGTGVQNAPVLVQPPSSTYTPPAPIPTATATNSETTFNVGTQIIQEPSTVLPPSATASGIPSDLPKMIQPPTGIPAQPRDSFLGQIGFKWPLNYPFVAANDGGNQIFEYLPPAISDALNLTRDEVVMHGLKPWDTTLTQGFITTLALFYIPADLNGTLAAQLRNPAAAFWHNKNQTVNDLTSLINTAIPLPAGPAAPAGQVPLSGDPGAAPSGYVAGGGPVGGDMDANRKVNPTSAGIATGAVMGAIAYGAAMFFVARRYRNKRLGHKRTSSVANTSRNTYSSLQAGAAFMSGGRGPGRLTPGGRDSRGSRGSSSSQGRSIRTQQISAPVMAENSLGWN
ncbi:uncharacterized protein EI97DRAFT_378694 [Westerdykella ornata]|uniref:Basic proline-rich protein n=1 Tax=Westerdykella ornata TaxID=318751 RepID=A0A6A6JI69_WESOR|nr:uncharacterized protein EI97DRAFT_378694 [Westerdykella ornata]KAF2275648.1 hypothetical protein EI97DRAFT_378694 [Westerdykella ornata]